MVVNGRQEGSYAQKTWLAVPGGTLPEHAAWGSCLRGKGESSVTARGESQPLGHRLTSGGVDRLYVFLPNSHVGPQAPSGGQRGHDGVSAL